MYGLNLTSSGAGVERFDRLVALASEAEGAGFDTVWTSEPHNRSATVPMAVLARGTERIRIGCNIAYGVGRTPVTWAAVARDLDEMSGGRVVLGLGNGTPEMMENWHGVSGASPAVRMEELVEVLRKLWRLDLGPVHHDGPFYSVHVVPTVETASPLRERLPIWTAGINPRMVWAAGRVADGLVGHPMMTARYVHEVVLPELTAGASSVGRQRSELTVMGILICAVHDDVEHARRQLAYAISQYAASRVYDRLFALHGWADTRQRIREAAKRRDVQALVRAVPEEAIDVIDVACRPGELAARVAEHARDYDHLSLVPPPWGLTPLETETATHELVHVMRQAPATFPAPSTSPEQITLQGA